MCPLSRESPAAPSDTRSFISIEMATAHPWPTSPSTLAAGMRASSKNTSLNSASPVACTRGRMVMPGASIGTANIVRPLCLGTSGSVRAMHMPNAARSADEVHTFWPVSTHSSPSRTARSWAAATSLPALGSLKSWHHDSSARSIGATWRRFCVSVPYWSTTGTHMPRVMVNTPVGR